jgi:hypothetical protein
MYRKPTANALTVLLIALVLTPLLAVAQGTVETQKGLPPDPNARTPEYAQPRLAPAPSRPDLEPSPGQPTLAPNARVGGGEQPGMVRWAFLRFWPVVLLGAGAAFLLIGAANVRRRSRRAMRG